MKTNEVQQIDIVGQENQDKRFILPEVKIHKISKHYPKSFTWMV